MKIIAYIQKDYYLWKIHRIVDYLKNNNSLSNSKEVDLKVLSKNEFSYQCLRDTASYDYFLACNVDDFNFHLLHKYLNYKYFVTFDEGQRNLNSADKYYQKKFSLSGEKKFYTMNKILRFPQPYGYYFNTAWNHFTFYDPKIFKHPLEKTIYLQRTTQLKKIKKVFLGVSSNWVYSHKDYSINDKKKIAEKIKIAADKINTIQPDIYISHPREGNEIKELLNSEISIIDCPNGSENFINMLSAMGEINLYTEKSGIIFELNKKIKVHFIDLFNRFTEDEYLNFQKLHKKFIDS